MPTIYTIVITGLALAIGVSLDGIVLLVVAAGMLGPGFAALPTRSPGSRARGRA